MAGRSDPVDLDWPKDWRAFELKALMAILMSDQHVSE
jgi:hypothetical protein